MKPSETLTRSHPSGSKAAGGRGLLKVLESRCTSPRPRRSPPAERRFELAEGTSRPSTRSGPNACARVHSPRGAPSRLRRNNLVETVAWTDRLARYMGALLADNPMPAAKTVFSDIPSYPGDVLWTILRLRVRQSVLGPAAYFLDVMSIIGGYITALLNCLIPPTTRCATAGKPDLFACRWTAPASHGRCRSAHRLVRGRGTDRKGHGPDDRLSRPGGARPFAGTCRSTCPWRPRGS